MNHTPPRPGSLRIAERSESAKIFQSQTRPGVLSADPALLLESDLEVVGDFLGGLLGRPSTLLLPLSSLMPLLTIRPIGLPLAMAAASGTAAPGPFAPPLRLCPIRVCAGLGRSFDSLQPTSLTPKLPEPNPITGRLASPPCSIENEIAPDDKAADLERRFPLWPPPREDPCPGSARPAFASLRSAVSKPSVNQP